jgi:hypothetical protein
MATQQSLSTVNRSGGSTSLADVIDRILDKGLVIDAWIRVSLVGLEILTIEARVVVASVDTYLRYADAISKLQLAAAPGQSRQVAPTPNPRKLPSAEEIQHYLESQDEHLSLDQLAEHFGSSREELGELLHRLESAGMVNAEQAGSQPSERHP